MANDSNQEPPAWVEARRVDEEQRSDRAKLLADASPVHLVKIDISFGTVFSLAVQVAIAQAIIAGAVLLALFAFNVI